MVNSAKWKSWTSYKGLSKEYLINYDIISREAENKYVDFVTKLVPQWKQADHCETLETTDSGESSMSSGFGMKVSTMTIPYIFYSHFYY